LVDVLEINDVVQSDIAEIKKLLKNLVELQLALKETKELPPVAPDNDSMFG
jgi:predicted transcriptional regulator